VVAIVDRRSEERVVAALSRGETRVYVLDVATRGVEVSA
jgi:hypothetical protein